MNKKYILILLILAIISIGSVSAASADIDVATADSDNIVLETQNEIDEVQTTQSNSLDENVLSADDEIGTYSELKNLIDSNTNGTIDLTKDYVFDSSASSSGITIDGSHNRTIINGNNHKIDAAQFGRIFTISGSNIVLKDIIFANAKVTGTYDYGGAIKWTGEGGQIINSTFINNTVYRYGGAVDFRYVAGTVINSTFINNIASNNYGGALSFYQASESKVINSTFINNKDNGGNGGAIYFYNSKYDEVINSTFIGNNAKTRGGAIYFDSQYGVILNSTFINSTTTTGDKGGAVYLNRGNGKLINSTFIRSKASSGAAIYVDDDNYELSNNEFYNNTASNSGGAIYVNGKNIVVNDSIFVNSHSDSTAGAIYVSAANGAISNSIFINTTSKSYGGAFYWTGTSASDGKIVNSTFINTTSGNQGGAIYWTSTKGKIENTKFINTRSTSGKGGAIYWTGTYGILINTTFVNTTAVNGDGGVIYWYASSPTIENTTFINSSALNGNGGAIYIFKSSGSKIINSTFINSNSSSEGGAIYLDGSSESEISNSKFINNFALNGNGGAIYESSSDDLKIKNSEFINNKASANAGAVYLLTGDSPVISDSLFKNNSAGEDGGAIYLRNTQEAEFTNNEFVNNSALNGGAIYDYASSSSNTRNTFKVLESNFTENTASNTAGALYIQGTSNDKLTLSNIKFIKNTAENAGALYVDDEYKAIINELTFEENTATNNGGALYLNNVGKSELSTLIFTSNSAKVGGAIYAYEAYNNEGNTISDSEFVKNTATNASAIYWDSSKNGKVTQSKFSENTADENGVIYWNSENGEVSESQFTDNTAENGVIYLNEGSLLVSENTISGEVKNAIYSSGDLTLKENDLDGNYIYLAKNTIKSEISIIVLNNQTFDARSENNDLKYLLEAVIVDDNDNKIILADDKLQFNIGSDVASPTQSEDGTWAIDYQFTRPGTYEVSAVHNDLNTANILTAVLTVKYDAELDSNTKEIDYLETGNVIITLNDNARGEIIVYLNDDEFETITLDDENKGTVNVNIEGLGAGTYDIGIAYSGDSNYYDDGNYIVLKVNKINPTIIISAKDIEAGETENITATLPETATGIITITVDGKSYTVSNGELLSVSDLASGTYSVVVSFAGDDNYNVLTNTTSFKVNKQTVAPAGEDSSVVSASEDGKIGVNLPSDASGYAIIDIDGTLYAAQVKDGKIDFAMPDSVSSGEHNVTVKYLGDSNYGGFEVAQKVNYTNPKDDGKSNSQSAGTQKVATSISAGAVTTVYNVAGNLVVTLKDTNGKALANKQVSVKVGTIIKTLTTNANGQASVNVGALAPNTYTATIAFGGDNTYVKSSGSANVVVSKATPKLTANKKTFKVKTKSKKYTVTLKTNTGKALNNVKVTIKVKGKTYKATVKKGKGTFKITKLTKKGKFKAVVKFAGNTYYKAVSKKVNIIIK